MARVLVTGSSGFLGRAVSSRLLAAGHRVTGLDPLPPPDAERRHVTDDLSDSGRLRELLAAESVTHIIHSGGVSGPMVLANNPDRVIAINVGGSLNLLQAALASGVKTFIYCSSVSALGDFYESDPIGDDYPLRPTSAYGCSKAAVDMVLRGLWRRVPLDLCSLRFTSIYGPGRQTSFVVDDIVTAALHGSPASVAPTTDWPYIYVDDAADAAVAACFSDQRQQLFYFIAYPEQVTLEDLANAAANDGTPVRLAVDNARSRAARGPLDIGPAQRDFGFAPKIDHHEGINRMVAAQRKLQA
ncbi:MAG: NAD(P)-dependent oxidoreductase [Rhizobiales bacterium]|nr:NAD(P)-dependent oxidoreductase [Hyphomicrobiales bacterium]